MNSGPTAERVYQALKTLIMTLRFRPGERLEPAALADLLSSSVTPVRDALHILTGEDLVRTRTGEGFHFPSLHEPGLDDLYAWSCETLILAIRARPAVPVPPVLLSKADGQDVATRTTAIFAGIAARSGNAEHGAAVSSVNDRLHSVRLVEPQAFFEESTPNLKRLEPWSSLRTAAYLPVWSPSTTGAGAGAPPASYAPPIEPNRVRDFSRTIATYEPYKMRIRGPTL